MGVQRRRAPFQVLVFPYRFRPDRSVEIALFRRTQGYWQGIAGGGDEAETPEDAARRETLEEAGLDSPGPFIALEPVLSIPVDVIRPDARTHWRAWLATIPCHPFAVRASGPPIRLSAEHTGFRWMPIGEAGSLVHWDTDRLALASLRAILEEGSGG